MAYDWRDALRRKLPHDLASGFPALPLLCRLFFLQLLEECDAEGRIRVGAAQPADVLSAMMGAHTGERRLLRQYVPALVEGGFLRLEGAFVCLRPVAAGVAAHPLALANNEPNELATNLTNSQRTERTANEPNELTTSVGVSARNHTVDVVKPAESAPSVPAVEPIAENPVVSVEAPAAPAVDAPALEVAEGLGGFPPASLPSLPHSPSLTLPPDPPSDREVLEARATPAEPTVAEIVGAAVAAGVAAGVAAARGTDEPPTEAKPPRTPRPDAPRPLAGTAAAEALEALEATQTLRGIVGRPAALALALTSGAYPAVDVPREIAAADAWLVANPANAKKRGERFAANWFSRAQERAKRVNDPAASGVRPVPAPTPAAANDYDVEAKRAEWQRKYDEQQAARAAKIARAS